MHIIYHHLIQKSNESTLGNITIYPNPSSDFMYVKNNIELEAVVIDLLGKELIREKITGRLDIYH